MNNLVAVTNTEVITVLQSSLYPGANPSSVELVLSYCRAAKLDPMTKPVHIVPMWDREAGKMRDVIMPGIGLYRTMAARSGEYAGMTEPEFGPDVTEKIGGTEITYPAWCKVTAKRLMRNGEIAEFSAIERWKENYAVKGGKEKSIAPNAMWQKRAYGQLSKCAQAQALRMAFPELVGAAPTAEEMEGRVYQDVAHEIKEPSTITPRAGARDAISPERRLQIEEVTNKAIDWLKEGAVQDALMELDNADFDTDERVYAWDQFSSAHRSLMTKERKRQAAEQPNPDLITDAQKKRLEARIAEVGIDREKVKDYCLVQFGKKHFAELTKEEYAMADEALESLGLATQA